MTVLTPLQIVIGDSLAKTTAGAWVANIHVQAGDVAFPDSRWSDFIDILLWWADALDGRQRHPVLDFMDGPFEMHFDEDAGVLSL